MSFGFSVGDVIAVGTLANNIRRQFLDASSDYDKISEDLKILANTHRNANTEIPLQRLTDIQKRELDATNQLCGSVLDDLQKYLDSNAVLGSSANGPRPRKIRKILQWDRGRIEQFRDRINLNRVLFNNLLGRVTNNLIVETSIQLEELQSQQHRGKASDKHQAVLEWLSHLDPSSQHNTASSLREPDTGEWFFERAEFQKWRDGDDKILFCYGMPGSGKTVLTSTVIHRFHEIARAESACVAYFYCNHQLHPKIELHELLLCLVKQIVRQSSDLPLAVESIFDLYKDVLFKPTIPDVSLLLESALACFQKTYIFIDAIDEFTSGRYNPIGGLHILNFMIERLVNNDVKLYFTSRLAPQHWIWSGSTPTIQIIEIHAATSDISLFLKRHEHCFPKFVHRKVELLNRVEEVVLEKASGQFLMVRLFHQHLASKRRLTSLNKALDHLNHAAPIYSEAYSLTLERMQKMDEDSWDLARSTLSLLSHALSPITSSALRVAIALEPGQKCFELDNMPEMDDLVTVCLGLITVGDEFVSFSHDTGRTYIQNAGTNWIPSPDDYMARCCLTCLSIQLDNFGVSDDGNTLADLLFDFYNYAATNWTTHVRDALCDVRSDTSILRVAIRDFLNDSERRLSYLRHMESVQGDMDLGDLEAITAPHITAYYGLAAAMPIILDDIEILDKPTSNGKTPIDIARYRSHPEVLEWLEQSKRSKIVQGLQPKFSRGPIMPPRLTSSERPMPFSYGSVSSATFPRRYEGLISCATYPARPSKDNLLGSDDHAAQSDPSFLSVDTPVTCASASFHPWMDGQYSQYLERAARNLDKDVIRSHTRADPMPHNVENALSAAILSASSSSNYHNSAVAIVSLLVENNVHLHSRSTDGRTPLSYASESGMESGVVEVLLSSESDISRDDADVKGRSAISYAASNPVCGSRIASLLISHGADVNSIDVGGWRPMHYAALNSAQGSSLVRILHNAAASVHSFDKYGRSPIMCSALSADVDTVTTLLELGAHIDDADQMGRTPLLYAAGNKEFGSRVIKKLVQSGADVSRVDQMGNSVVTELSRHSATQTHIRQTLEILKNAGAPLDLGDVNGRTPLSIAAQTGTEECLEWLLEQDVRVDSKDTWIGTPLSWSAVGDNIMAASLLLDAGAELNAANGHGWTPVMYAALCGSLSVLLFLIDQRADIERKTQYGTSALMLAAMKGQFECADLLLRSGAAADVSDGQGKTALRYAWENGHVDMYELLKMHLGMSEVI